MRPSNSSFPSIPSAPGQQRLEQKLDRAGKLKTLEGEIGVLKLHVGALKKLSKEIAPMSIFRSQPSPEKIQEKLDLCNQQIGVLNKNISKFTTKYAIGIKRVGSWQHETGFGKLTGNNALSATLQTLDELIELFKDSAREHIRYETMTADQRVFEGLHAKLPSYEDTFEQMPSHREMFEQMPSFWEMLGFLFRKKR